MRKSTLLCFAGFALFAACKVNGKQVEDNISSKMKEMGVEMKSVSCPSGGGDKYTCTGETKDGDKVSFDVTSDGSGGIKWELRGKILDMKVVGDNLESEMSGADVSCPKKTVVFMKGKTVTCDVKVKGQSGKVEITATDDEGHFKQKIVGGGGDDDDDKGKKKKKGDDDDDDK